MLVAACAGSSHLCLENWPMVQVHLGVAFIVFWFFGILGLLFVLCVSFCFIWALLVKFFIFHVLDYVAYLPFCVENTLVVLLFN